MVKFGSLPCSFCSLHPTFCIRYRLTRSVGLVTVVSLLVCGLHGKYATCVASLMAFVAAFIGPCAQPPHPICTALFGGTCIHPIQAHAWQSLAQHCSSPYDQLAARRAALAALENYPLAKVGVMAIVITSEQCFDIE